MFKFMSVFVLIVGLCITNLAFGQDKSLEQKHDQLMKPTVRVTADKTTGSGTIIYSDDRDQEGTFETYVLTNHHVIASAIRIEESWDPKKQTMRDMEERSRVKVEIFIYDRGTAMGQKTFEADIVA